MNCKLELGSINGSTIVFVEKKEIKNVHLKVYRDLTVKLSVPSHVPDEWIEQFLKKKTKWINNQIYKYKQSSGSNNLAYIKNGSTIQIMGKDKRVYLKQGKPNIEQDEKKIVISLKDSTNLELATKNFNEWWRKESGAVYIEQIKFYYDAIFKKYKIAFPSLQIRKMKTMWGNCNTAKSLITLNEYLYKANMLCIQYVILHEMTHLLYPKHNDAFYNFLTIHMPEWKERKKMLDFEVVQGL